MESKFRILALLGISCLLQGCITWHKQPKFTTDVFSTPVAPILAYSVEFRSYVHGYMDGEKEIRGINAGIEATRLFGNAERHGGRTAYQRNGGTARYFLEVSTYHKGGFWGNSLNGLALGTVFLFPSFSRRHLDVECAVYERGSRGVYRTIFHKSYDIRRRELIWLPALLFVWINYLTDGAEDVYKNLTRDCLRGAVQK